MINHNLHMCQYLEPLAEQVFDLLLQGETNLNNNKHIISLYKSLMDWSCDGLVEFKQGTAFKCFTGEIIFQPNNSNGKWSFNYT